MQQYFNNRKWRKETRFTNFATGKDNKLLTKVDFMISMACYDGYITETSPLGTRVCRGYISYIHILDRKDLGNGMTWTGKGTVDMDWKHINDKVTGKEDCRWK